MKFPSSFARNIRPIVLAPLAVAVVGASLVSNFKFAASDTPNLIYITNANLTKRSDNCADYAANYGATVEDIGRGVTHNAKVSISADETACTIASNAIPNHDFNATGRFAHVVSAQTQTYRVSVNPEFADKPTPLNLRLDNAVLLNGVKVDLLAVGCYGVGDGRIGCNDMSASYK